MFDDTFPEGKPATNPLYELRTLRMAYRLLVATNQLDTAADLLIAQQVLNVLTHGTRHAPQAANAPVGPAPGDDCIPRANLIEGYDAMAAHNYNANYSDISFPADIAHTPEPESFTIAARVEQLGYKLTVEQANAHLPSLQKLARVAWRNQFAGEPTLKAGEDWYDLSEARWIDNIIHTYLAQFPWLVHAPQADARTDGPFPAEPPMPESYTAMERAHQLGYQVTQSGPGLTPEAHAALMPGLRQAAREAYEQVWKGKLDDKKSDGCYTAMDLFWLDPLIKRYFATKRGCAQVPGEGM